MLFNSIEFFLFFPIVTALYFLLPHQWRWLMLLIASCVFYMFFVPAYIFILLATILVDYVAAIRIERSSKPRARRWLIGSIISTILILAIFKYYNFQSKSIARILDGRENVIRSKVMAPKRTFIYAWTSESRIEILIFCSSD